MYVECQTLIFLQEEAVCMDARRLSQNFNMCDARYKQSFRYCCYTTKCFRWSC